MSTTEMTREEQETTPVTEPVRERRRLPWAPVVGVVLVAVALLLPQYVVTVPGVLPGATYEPGTLQLLALCLLIGALAVTYNLVFAVTGLLSFGHALYFAVGAYTFAMLLEHAGLGLVPAALLSLLAGTLTALVVGLVSLRVTGIAFAMVTLAFAQAGSVLVLKNVHGLTGGEEGLGLLSARLPDWFLGVANTKHLYWLALGVAVLVMTVTTWVVGSRAGHLMMAVRENELRVRVLGVRPYVVRLVAFVAAGAMATLIGMAYALLQGGVSPRVTTADFTLTLLVMVVLGGLGTRWGAMLGGMVYTLLDQRLGVLASSDGISGLPDILRVPLSQPQFLLGALFVLVVMFLPGGLSGLADRLPGHRRPAGVLEELDAQAGEPR